MSGAREKETPPSPLHEARLSTPEGQDTPMTRRPTAEPQSSPAGGAAPAAGPPNAPMVRAPEPLPSLAPPVTAHNGRRRLITILIPALLATLILVGYGFYWFFYQRGTVFTDNAKVEGDVIPCASRHLGRIVELPFSEGMKVSRGSLVARLDDTDALAELRQADARVAVARANLEKLEVMLAKARAEIDAEINVKRAYLATSQAVRDRTLSGARRQEIEIARSQVKAARTRATLRRRELERVRTLVQGKTLSQGELDEAETLAHEAEENLRTAELNLILLETGARQEDRQAAKSNVAAARAELGKSTSRLKEIDLLQAEQKVARAELDLAQAQRANAAANLEETRILAPADGVVARIHTKSGQVVKEGQAIITLVNNDSLWVQANMEEDDIGEIKPGDPATIWVDAYSGRSFKGEVENVMGAALSKFSLFSATSSSGNYIKVTQRVPVRIRFIENHLPPMYPGINAEVRIRYR